MLRILRPRLLLPNRYFIHLVFSHRPFIMITYLPKKVITLLAMNMCVCRETNYSIWFKSFRVSFDIKVNFSLRLGDAAKRIRTFYMKFKINVLLEFRVKILLVINTILYKYV